MCEEFELVSSYSHPFQDKIASSAGMIVAEHSKSIIELFLDRHSNTLARNSDGLVECLQDWLRSDASFNEAWHPSIGIVHSLLLTRRSISPEATAAAVALHLNASGFQSEWQTRLPAPTRFAFGRRLLPIADEIAVVERQGKLHPVVSCTSGQEAVPLAKASTQPDDESPLLNVIRISEADQIIVAEDFVTTVGLDRLSEKIDLQPDRAFHSSCARAAALLEQYSAHYARWTDSVLRRLVPIRATSGGEFESGSFQHLPGLIYLSNVDSTAHVAEGLIHESCHQYFYIIKRLHELHDAGDCTLYFSAIKECGRPAIYILLAYHAFANVCLFFDKAARCGFDCGPEYASYLAELRRKVDSLEVQLQSIKSFTPHGDMLWRALADRLHCEEETLGQ